VAFVVGVRAQCTQALSDFFDAHRLGMVRAILEAPRRSAPRITPRPRGTPP
jgi:hypothetical protein